jgi:hypothetical protein
MLDWPRSGLEDDSSAPSVDGLFHFKTSVRCRLLLLDRLGYAERAQALYTYLSATKALGWVARASKTGGKNGGINAGRTQLRWRISVQRHPEVDE